MSDMALSATKGGILDDYLTPEQLIAELGISLVTLNRWRLQRKAPPVTKIGRKVLFKRSSVEAWAASRELSPAIPK